MIGGEALAQRGFGVGGNAGRRLPDRAAGGQFDRAEAVR